MTLHDYWHLLNGLDWYYEYSDDPSVFRKGQAAISRAHVLAVTSPAHASMFHQFRYGDKRPECPAAEVAA